MIKLVSRALKSEDFFKNAASSLRELTDGQIVMLADGIAEVRRRRRGCLVFIGPIYHCPADDTYWFLDPQRPAKRLEVTRLGVALSIISQIPETFSLDFRGRFADATAMDGETIVFTAPQDAGSPPAGFKVDRPKGSIETRRFVQLAERTPALLDMRKPRISKIYADAWEQAARLIKKDDLPGPEGVDCVAISDLQRTELLSLGTRHRKAAMTTMCIDSIVAITCSASGKLKIWVGGVPIAELAPRGDHLLPHLSRPQVLQEKQ